MEANDRECFANGVLIGSTAFIARLPFTFYFPTFYRAVRRPTFCLLLCLWNCPRTRVRTSSFPSHEDFADPISPFLEKPPKHGRNHNGGQQEGRVDGETFRAHVKLLAIHKPSRE